VILLFVVNGGRDWHILQVGKVTRHLFLGYLEVLGLSLRVSRWNGHMHMLIKCVVQFARYLGPYLLA
jgi:hypothetical protein